MNTSENSITAIDAHIMRRMISNSAAAIENNVKRLNDLNVFPVPDGDTGSNMALTVSAAANELSKHKTKNAGEIADIAAKAMLRNARGNSGVITSLLFRGFSSEIKNHDECTSLMLAHALQSGVAAVYKSVSNPAEGTILTVARLAADAAVETAENDDDIAHIFDATIDAAKIALDKTPEMNPVLKKAGVVDAGGYGWVLILEAMKAAVDGVELKSENASSDIKESADFSDFDDEDINFTYCTEFIVSRAGDKDPAELRKILEAMGDSLVLVEDDEIIKVHVHTDDPGEALHHAVAYGQFVSVKVENMRIQHTNKIVEGEQKNDSPTSGTPAEKYGVVAVSPGDGITEVFKSLGVDVCVAGGQTMNPSTDDILDAVEKVNAETVFVLPNNKNIILAAEQARELSSKNVVVIPSRTVPQGICAMEVYDTDLELDDICEAMKEALSGVSTMQLTTAVRDSDINGLGIEKDDYIALCEGELMAGGKNENALLNMLIEKINATGRDIITIYYGEDITEDDALKVEDIFEAVFGEDNVSLVSGGQSVYRYIISAE